jgi:hypothetical protein
VTPPWRLVNQRLETSKQPHELHLEVAADRGSLFPCPVCVKPCKAHDFAEFTWRHLNFFQHHCYITAKIPRTAGRRPHSLWLTKSALMRAATPSNSYGFRKNAAAWV